VRADRHERVHIVVMAHLAFTSLTPVVQPPRTPRFESALDPLRPSVSAWGMGRGFSVKCHATVPPSCRCTRCWRQPA
jgi:hypothetical protein